MDRVRSKDQYKQSYPKTSKWLNICIICQSEGYKPDLPKQIFPGEMAQNIREMWDELNVNELNICEDCVSSIE